MKKLTKILALTLTLALLACGFIIAASADEAGEATLLVSETGASLPQDYLETSVDYAKIGRDVLYFYAPESVTSVSEGYKIVEGEGTPEGYNRWERLAFAVYNYKDKGELYDVGTVADVDSMTNIVYKWVKTNSKGVVIILYRDIDFNGNKVKYSNAGTFFNSNSNICIDLNGYTFSRTAASDLGAAKQLTLTNCATSSKHFAIVSTEPGGKFIFYTPTGFSAIFNGSASGAASQNYYIGSYPSTFSALGGKAVYNIDVTAGTIVHNNNSSAKTGSCTITVKNATINQIDNAKNPTVFHNYTKTKITVENSTIIAAPGKSVFNFVSGSMSGGDAGNHVAALNGSTIKNSVISGLYIFQNLDCVATDSEKANITITNSLLDGTLYGGTPGRADYVTLGAGCMIDALPAGYESYVNVTGGTLIDAVAAVGNASASYILGEAGENETYTFTTTLSPLTIKKGGYSVTLDGNTYSFAVKPTTVKNTSGETVGEFYTMEEAFKALETGYYIDVDAGVGVGVIPRDVEYFYVDNNISLEEYILSETPGENGYYTATRVAFIAYTLDGTGILVRDTDPARIRTAFSETEYWKDSKLSVNTKVVLFKNINLTTALFNIASGKTVIVDLNGYKLSRTNTAKSNESIFGLGNGNVNLTLQSSYEGGEVVCTGTTYAAIFYGSGESMKNNKVTINGENLTVHCDTLINLTMYSASTTSLVSDNQLSSYISNPCTVTINGGTYYYSLSDAKEAYAIRLNCYAKLTVSDATFYGRRGFIYQAEGYCSGLYESTVTNTKVFAVQLTGTNTSITALRSGGADGEPFTLYDIAIQKGWLTTTEAEYGSVVYNETTYYWTQSGEASYSSLATKYNRYKTGTVTFEDCVLIGSLYNSASEPGHLVLGANNYITYTSAKLDANNTLVSFKEGVKPVRMIGNVSLFDQTRAVKYVTLYESDERVISVTLDGADAEYWLKGSSYAAADLENTTGAFYYEFAGWKNEAGDVVTALEESGAYTAVYSLVADVEGISYRLIDNNGFVFVVYVPVNDAIVAPEGATVVAHPKTGEDAYLYAVAVSAGNVESVGITVTVTDGENSATETVAISLGDYFTRAMRLYSTEETIARLLVNAVNYCNESYKYVTQNAGYLPYEEIVLAYPQYITASEKTPAPGFENEAVSGVAIYVGGDQRPVLVFKRADGSTLESIRVITAGGEVTAAVKEMFDAYFFVADVNVENLADDVTLVIGENEYTYNLEAYIASEGSAETLATAILGYAEAVKAYNEANVPENRPLKVLFLGNSFVFMGQTVIEKKQTVLDIARRQNDTGLFYQLCKANGLDVEVTNWTFGGHRLDQLFMTECDCDRDCIGQNHLVNLTDRYYDIVIASPGSGTKSAENLTRDFNFITDFFRAENPNVKIVCCGNMSATGYTADPEYRNPEIYNQYQVLEDMGILVADWGGVAKRLMTGEYSTGTGKYDYYNHTFVISKDDYHPGQLSGYLTTLMVYCVITGESAVGQTYEMCGNASYNEKFDFDSYITQYYTAGGTNYKKIFADAEEMRLIQEIVDYHIATKPYRTND